MKPKPAKVRPGPETLTTREVAARFGVHPRRVQTWVRDELIFSWFRTPGGHLRFYRSEIDQLVTDMTEDRRP